MKSTIKHTFFFPNSEEMIWDYLTKPELLSQWLMPNNIKPMVGHKFQFTTKPIPSLNIDGVMDCEIIEVSPFNRLSYSWKAGPEPGKTTLDTLVVWTLTPKNGGTELHLEHSGFKEGENAAIYDGMNSGWAKNVEKMLAHINKSKNE